MDDDVSHQNAAGVIVIVVISTRVMAYSETIRVLDSAHCHIHLAMCKCVRVH